MLYRRLPDLALPLANRFYRDQRAPARVRGGDAVWVAQAPEPIAALCLRPEADGHWLTRLLVAAPQRRRGVASGLVRTARAAHPGPIWLFCHPDLAGFYARLDFQPCTDLPATLTERLARYRRSKPLIALGNAGLSQH
ncbi:GNAT family N-acetyltransferase [Pseudomonas sp. RIT-PI-AD]|uniref:GNAT family N-acetyltransferase n=1 Tax=Pseudomonas sp. RIT-PI-AD TaxID=3035294 RepID=UPI0021DB3F8C|nr:GNAT family N-acetyltransferase [Pseudomonas sp. RIT-PI-AD]